MVWQAWQGYFQIMIWIGSIAKSSLNYIKTASEVLFVNILRWSNFKADDCQS